MTDRQKALRAEYKKLAKRADQRLIRLKAKSYEMGFHNITEWAYKSAQSDISRMFPEADQKMPRFNRKLDEDLSTLQLMSRINAVKRFLDLMTSSVSNIKRMFVKRAKTISQEYDIPLTWEDVAKMADIGFWDTFDSQYGSKTVMTAIGSLSKSDKKSFIKRVGNMSDNHIKLSDSDVQDLLEPIIEQYFNRKE